VWPPAGETPVAQDAAGASEAASRSGWRSAWSRVQRLDTRLIERSRKTRSPCLDRALVTITHAATYSRLWMAIAGALALTGRPVARTAAARGVTAVALASVISNGPVKLVARRRRPPSSPHGALIPMPSSTSFPSGHAASAFAFATAASAELPSLAPALLPLAAAVAYSRVHAGVHYPSDVAAGAACGVLCGLIASQLARPNSRPRCDEL
jgi:membrane-associated phospholipid phosphatase